MQKVVEMTQLKQAVRDWNSWKDAPADAVDISLDLDYPAMAEALMDAVETVDEQNVGSLPHSVIVTNNDLVSTILPTPEVEEVEPVQEVSTKRKKSKKISRIAAVYEAWPVGMITTLKDLIVLADAAYVASGGKPNPKQAETVAKKCLKMGVVSGIFETVAPGVYTRVALVEHAPVSEE